MEGKVLFKTFASEIEATVIQLKLEENEIPSWLLNKKDSSYLTFGEIELYINDDHVTQANQVLSEL